MNESGNHLTCRHCGRAIAVRASRCPWCRQTIMVICAACKSYTDDQGTHCESCDAPLKPDRMDGIALVARVPDVARLARDQDRAQPVASAVVFGHLDGFFFDDGRGHRAVFAHLLGSDRGRAARAAALFFAAYAYLCQKQYCTARLVDKENDDQQRILLDRLRPWDGQDCIESALADRAYRAMDTRQATDSVVRDLMGFRVKKVRGASARTVLGPRSAPLNLSDHLLFAAIDRAVRLTVRTDWDPQEACRTTHQLLVAFVGEDRARARVLIEETVKVLRWFERYESDPSIAFRGK